MYLIRPIVLYFHLTRVIVLELLDILITIIQNHLTVLTQLSQVSSPILINETRSIINFMVVRQYILFVF